MGVPHATGVCSKGQPMERAKAASPSERWPSALAYPSDPHSGLLLRNLI